jgi:hypothetical protein
MKYSRYSLKVIWLLIVLSVLLTSPSNLTAQQQPSELTCYTNCRQTFAACLSNCSGLDAIGYRMCTDQCRRNYASCIEICRVGRQ